MAKKLFAEFPPVTTQQWEEAIIKDLKGADYEKKLVWRTPEGFAVRPYYRAEDLDHLKLALSDRRDNRWRIHQTLSCTGDLKQINNQALAILDRGVNSLGFALDDKKILTEEDFSLLLNGITIPSIEISFQGVCLKSRETLFNFLKYVSGQGLKKEEIKVCFGFNPMRPFTTKGHFCEEGAYPRIKECLDAVKEYPNIRVISVDAVPYSNAGANLVQELAFALAQAKEHISRLQNLGFEGKEVAERMWFSFAVGSSYFMEIAKFRCVRTLWKNICGLDIDVFATTSAWNQTIYDPYVNMLRGTTEAMSAAIGGVNTLEVLPFDNAFHPASEFSSRIARNVQNILKEESHFDKVADPGAGSYYIENLTNSLMEAASQLFETVNKDGGYVASFKKGFIQSEIKSVSDKKDKNIATRRQTLLGTNQFPNFLEKADKDITLDQGAEHRDKELMAQPLPSYRGSIEFEKLRLATDRSGKSPKAFMLTFGNLAMCRARAQFSSNFFAVAGIRVIDNNRFSTIEEGVKAALASKAEIVVACSSDDEYTDAVPAIAQQLGDKAILVVAGDPLCKDALEAKGIHNFINVKSNVLETLRHYQQLLNIQ